MYLPHNAAHKMSELKRFLYFLISGASVPMSSAGVGVTLTLICEPRLEACEMEPIVEPSAPKPKAEKDRWCLIDGVLLTAIRY